MPYQVSPTDPIVSFDIQKLEKAVALKLKAAGIASQAALDAVIANLTPANNTGMSNAACQGEQTLLAMFTLVP